MTLPRVGAKRVCALCYCRGNGHKQMQQVLLHATLSVFPNNDNVSSVRTMRCEMRGSCTLANGWAHLGRANYDCDSLGITLISIYAE